MAARVFRGARQASFNFHEKIIDNFAGWGGVSTGLEAAFGRPVDIAINHSPDAIRAHEVNHPHTKHYCESVWAVDPAEICAGLPVGLLWLSPDCTHFSNARGNVPVKKEIRGLAWVALRYASLPCPSKPRVIMLENVSEFMTWGPLRTDANGNSYPCPKRKGQTFNAFVRALQRHGYAVEYRTLVACDYGAPTSRKRFFLVARCDGRPIVWPQPTHGPGLLPYRTAADCIDWSLPCPSIFLNKEEGKAAGVRRPLAEATMRRIAAGVMRYVINHPDPFIAPAANGFAACAPFITEHANASSQRNMAANEPMRTICGEVKGGHFALVSAFLAKHYTGVVGSDLRDPMGTITGVDHHSVVTSTLERLGGQSAAADRVSAFLVKFYSEGGQWQDLREPMHTIPANDRMGLVMVRGEPYRIVDIGMRMLTPGELFKGNGFPDDYIFDRDIHGRPFTKKQQVKGCGNSVPPQIPEALARANLVDEAPAEAAAA